MSDQPDLLQSIELFIEKLSQLKSKLQQESANSTQAINNFNSEFWDNLPKASIFLPPISQQPSHLPPLIFLPPIGKKKCPHCGKEV
jgi:hypothetical protein